MKSQKKEKSILQLYLKEIDKTKLLSYAEEIKLSHKVKNGDKKARDLFIRSNLRFVVKIAHRYKSQENSLIDLINEGNIGLMRAVDKFDPKLGFHFTSFAVWSIRQAITKFVQDGNHLVHLPKNKIEKLKKLTKTQEELTKEKKTNIKFLSEFLNIKVKDLSRLMEIKQGIYSLDAKITEEENLKLLDIIEDKENITPEEILEEVEMKHQINKCLESLTLQERKVLKMRFGLGMISFSLQQTGKIIGLSRERIRQIEIKALLKLRNSEEGKKLAIYLNK